MLFWVRGGTIRVCSYWRIYWYLTADTWRFTHLTYRIPVKSHGFGNEITVSRWLHNFSSISIKTKFTKINTMVWWINR